MGALLGLPLPVWFDSRDGLLLAVLLEWGLTIGITSINWSYFTGGFRSFVQRSPTMDTLIAMGATAALLYSLYGTIRLVNGFSVQHSELMHQYAHDLYLESAAAILSLVTLGKYLEALSKRRTSQALSRLNALTPQTALVLRMNREMEIPVHALRTGDVVVLKAGMSVPADGIITQGNGVLNEASLTGESRPVEKQQGDKLFAGTVLNSGYLLFRITETGSETMWGKIIRLVEEAGTSKAPIARLADRISRYFVPAVLGVAVVTVLCRSWQGLF
jgi:cation transport ATPase